VGVAATAPAALLLESSQSLGLPRSASETYVQWSLGVAVANAAEVPPTGVPAAPAEHAFHLCVCCQTSIESTYIKSDSTVFQHKKRCIEVFTLLNKRASSLTLNTAKHNFSDK
jgi:hypothetical protein